MGPRSGFQEPRLEAARGETRSFPPLARPKRSFTPGALQRPAARSGRSAPGFFAESYVPSPRHPHWASRIPSLPGPQLPFAMLTATLLLAALQLGTPTPLPLELDWSGGIIGDTVTFRLEGSPNSVCYLIPSGTEGPTPLALIDPSDPRFLDVGLDLLNSGGPVLLNGSGVGTRTLNIPPLSFLQGAPLYAQAVELNPPGSPTAFGALSNRTRFAMTSPNTPAQALGEMLEARRAHGLVRLLDGRVLLIGGETPTDPPVPLDTIEVYDPRDETFRDFGPKLATARSRMEATVLQSGRVLITGGVDAAGGLSSAELIDPNTRTILQLPDMLTRRVEHTQTRLLNGNVLILGGFSGPYTPSHPYGFPGSVASTQPLRSTIADRAEIFDEQSLSFFSLDSPSLAGHAASSLPDGRVLITGGLAANQGAPQAFDEAKGSFVFTPQSNQFTTTSDLPLGRAFHQQITLASGEVLVTGGGNVVFDTLNFGLQGTPFPSVNLNGAAVGQWVPGPNDADQSPRGAIICYYDLDGVVRYRRIPNPDGLSAPQGGMDYSSTLGASQVWTFEGTTLGTRVLNRAIDLTEKNRHLVTSSAAENLSPSAPLDKSAESIGY